MWITNILQNNGIYSRAKSIKALKNIELLKKNWNGYNSNSISKIIIDNCLKLVMGLNFQPEIIPTSRETIQFEYELPNGKYLEFEIFNEYIDILKVDENEKEYKEKININVERINELVYEFLNKKIKGGVNNVDN